MKMIKFYYLLFELNIICRVDFTSFPYSLHIQYLKYPMYLTE
jgi:hypothetical protein